MKNYIKYLKNNPKNYWFKRKLYGWGWVPATKEGWMIILIWAIIFIFSISKIEKNDSEIGRNLFVILIETIILIFIAYKKGEKPKWSWGK